MNYVVISIVMLISCLQNTDCKFADGVPGDVCVCAEPHFSFPRCFVMIAAVTWRSAGEELCMHWER